MEETIIFEATIPVKSSRSEIYDTVEHFRSAKYGAPSSRLLWASAPGKAAGETAMATLQDNCPRDGHVLIHLYANKEGLTLKIEGIQRHVAADRRADSPEVKEYAKEMRQVLRQNLSLLTEHFTIPDMVSNFVTWVNEYGHMRQSHYIPHSPENTRAEYQMQLAHSVDALGNTRLGELIFHIERDKTTVDHFTATVEPYNGLNPVRDEVIGYMHEIAAAIRERWSQDTAGPQAPVLPPDILLLPTKPEDDWEREDVFDWYHRGGKLFIPELKGLAPYLGLSEGSVNNAHAAHKDIYTSGRKPRDKSMFAGMLIPQPEDE